MYFERSGVTSLPTVVAAVVTVTLTLILSPYIDYRMVAVFVPMAYTLTCILNCIIFKRISGKMPIDGKKTIPIYLFTVGYAFLIFAFRGAFLVRMLLVLPLLFPLFSTGKRLYSLVREE